MLLRWNDTLSHAQSHLCAPTVPVASASPCQKAGHQGSAGQGETCGNKDGLCVPNAQDLTPQQTSGDHQQTEVAWALDWRLPYLHKHAHVLSCSHISTSENHDGVYFSEALRWELQSNHKESEEHTQLTKSLHLDHALEHAEVEINRQNTNVWLIL